MRLTEREVRAINAAAAQVFGANATVRLFGGRLDDARRGGDIDLHVETDATENAFTLKQRFLERLFARIDEQKVDVLVTRRGASPSAIERIAYRDGIVL